MAAFLTDLEVKELEDGGILVAPFKYQSDLVPYIITVPTGFKTDFASVPRLPIIFTLCGGTAKRPAVIHDYLYRTGITSRKMADDIFLEAMKLEGVPMWRRWMMWAGVRVGAGAYYKG